MAPGPVRPLTIARARAAAVRTSCAAPGLLLLGGITLWLAAMAPRLEAEALFGPLCSGHGSLFALHCPACYAAAAMAAAGLALAGRQLARRR